ncbi:MULTISPECIES: MFS transporter [Halorubrum]|uniref:Major facilitator superfamily protein n=1 Tax=Halorubrum hochstenium ATCC 700873 TaxID=1227481 RepID=M0FB75_9EURY|nr:MULTISPECIES: MFS transporter [Halorubrum]ELZ57200.1 major facilitator superfamily protein [Halorubrum hochstenium ATCC 700873]
MSDRWLYAWGLASVAFGGASLVVPLYVVDLGGGPFVLGILAAVAAIVGVPGALWFGRVADRTGRRRGLVLVALVATALAVAVVPLTDRIAAVIAANAVVWFAFAAATPVLTLLAVADAPEAAWSERIADLNRYQGVGWALGLLLGTAWTVGGALVASPAVATRSLFAPLAVAAALSCVAAVRTLPADPTGDRGDGPDALPSGSRVRRAIRRADRFAVRGATLPGSLSRTDFRGLDPRRLAARFTPGLAAYFLAALLFLSGFSAFFAPLPAFLTEIGFGSGGTFALYLINSAAAAVAFGTAGRLAADGNVVRLQVGGLVARAVAFPAVALFGSALGAGALGFVAVGVAFASVGLTWAVIAVTAGVVVTRLAPPAIRGEALGAYAALGALAGGIGSVLGGWLAAIGYGLAFGVAAALVLVGAAAALAVDRRVDGKRPRPST